jgi:DNA-binding CsgD family transcriptional regulator
LSGLTTNAPAQPLGEELCRIGATAAFIFGTNKRLRDFCVVCLEEDLVVVGLEAIADFYALVIQEYIQTYQAARQIAAFRTENTLKAKLLLTASEITALKMLARGMNNKEIATEMGVSERTVVSYLKQAREKLGTRSRPDTVVKAIDLGIIDIQEES